MTEECSARARAFIEDAERTIETDGVCPICDVADFPVDIQGQRIVSQNVEHATEWHIEHDPGCTHVLVTQLLAHIEKALPLLQAAEALEEAFVKGSSLIVTIQLDYTDATQYGRMVSIEIQNLDKLPRRVLAGTVACLTVADAIADTPRILGEIL